MRKALIEAGVKASCFACSTLSGEKSLNDGAAELVIRDHQHVRPNARRAIEAQLFQLLGIRHLLQIDLHVVLLLKIADRGFDASGFLMSSQTLSCPAACACRLVSCPAARVVRISAASVFFFIINLM